MTTKHECVICHESYAATRRNFPVSFNICFRCERYEARDSRFMAGQAPDHIPASVSLTQQRAIDRLNARYQSGQRYRRELFRAEEQEHWREYQRQLCVLLGIPYAPCRVAVSDKDKVAV